MGKETQVDAALPPVKDYTDLLVWQQAREIVKRIYQHTSSFPKEEQFGLTQQMRRAAVSAPSNIAEGYARESLREYLHHLSIAVASLAELQTQLMLSKDLNFVSEGSIGETEALVGKTIKMLHNLRKALKARL